MVDDNRYGGWGRGRDDDDRRHWQDRDRGYGASGRDHAGYGRNDDWRQSSDRYEDRDRGYERREHLASGRSFDARRADQRYGSYDRDRGASWDRDRHDDRGDRYFSGARDTGDTNYFRESYGGDRNDDRNDRRDWSAARGGYGRDRDDDRSWTSRAGDTVRSWFDDDDRRRDDVRDRERGYGGSGYAGSSYSRDRDWRR